ncbi:MAG: hypothetical protein A3F68_08125 [Acidobacteria bacterium RIFCSPLOWO2_12_FULL_54_10]|nr:MAG: hypothetical protein A3F68_08125 [Acidobacteria bacterium RIFCSPLOWO2_12_FULL_54_10]
MAQSPSHQFGQMIGDMLEATLSPILKSFAQKYGLYFDKQGQRSARAGNKLSWTDLNGNKHDLDFVLERGGTPSKIGIPIAFIETAWRRYTKHSRNKVQEIQGALIPLLETYSRQRPFAGAVLAGVFTTGALSQLRSLGFAVAYLPYSSVVRAFESVGINAAFDEDTPDNEFAQRMAAWKGLSSAKKSKVAKALVALNKLELERFVASLRQTVERSVKTIRILPLHGTPVEYKSLDEALAFFRNYDESSQAHAFIRYEVQVSFVNSDRVVGEFGTRTDALSFLESFQVHSKRKS